MKKKNNNHPMKIKYQFPSLTIINSQMKIKVKKNIPIREKRKRQLKLILEKNKDKLSKNFINQIISSIK